MMGGRRREGGKESEREGEIIFSFANGLIPSL